MMDFPRRCSPRFNKNDIQNPNLSSFSGSLKCSASSKQTIQDWNCATNATIPKGSNSRGGGPKKEDVPSGKENCSSWRRGGLSFSSKMSKLSSSIYTSKSLSTLNLTQLKTEATKTAQNFRTTFGTITQKLRRSTRRRHRLLSTPSPTTPGTSPARRRSPLKMYSPFRIDTPSKALAGTGTAGRYTPRRRRQDFQSASRNFREDVEAVNHGLRQLNTVADDIVSRGSSKK